jgi:hypothetical protein
MAIEDLRWMLERIRDTDHRYEHAPEARLRRRDSIAKVA